MTLYPPLPPRQPSYPSGRYVRTDPLRREFGLKLLSEPLPEPLRTTLIRAWRRPVRYDGNQAIQNLHRQRPDEANLPAFPSSLLGVISLTELEVVSTPAIRKNFFYLALLATRNSRSAWQHSIDSVHVTVYASCISPRKPLSVPFEEQRPSVLDNHRRYAYCIDQLV